MNQPGLGSMPCMNSSEPVSTPARASAAQASGPWIARNTRSSASTLQSKPAASLRRCASSSAALPALATIMKRSVAEPGHDQVVDDAGLLVEEERVFRLRHRQPRRIERAGSGDQIGRTRSGHFEQLHMRNVEQAGMLAGMQVLLHDAGRIGDRHRPAGKRPEAGGRRDVQVLEGELFQVRRRSLLLQSARIPPLSRLIRAPLSEA